LKCKRVVALLLLLSTCGFVCATVGIQIRPAFAQQLDNNATTDIIKQPVEGIESSVCTSVPTGYMLERDTIISNISMTIANGSANSTTYSATTIIGRESNLSTSEIRDYIKEACIALQIDDSEGALFFLDLALDGV